MSTAIAILLVHSAVAILDPTWPTGATPNPTVSQALASVGAPTAEADETAAAPRPDGSDQTFHSWHEIAARAQATQPNWVTPLATQTARLKEELRYDVSWQVGPGNQRTLNYGSSKGLELIPAERFELSLLPPPYLVHEDSPVRNGFGDVSAAMRFRIASAAADAGDYVATFIVTTSLPTGNGSNGAPTAIVTPTLAFGKGWGRFDVQTSAGAVLPTGDVTSLGRQIAINTALQFHALRYLWPDCEVNGTFYEGGPSANKVQVLVTPGVVVGRFGVGHALSAVVGLGDEIAVSPYHKFTHNDIISLRFPF
jgi:hypothetical protein